LESFRPLFAASQVELRWVPAADLPLIQGDAAKLRRVLANLLDNALKHTPAAGSVTLALQRLSAECQVQCMVVDSGEGIPPQERERIWERFYRVDRARIRGRSGLGLAIVKEIVEAHGGAVGVDSHVGSGSTFWIRLPA
jgi:signal transduction histidine kinase